MQWLTLAAFSFAESTSAAAGDLCVHMSLWTLCCDLQIVQQCRSGFLLGQRHAVELTAALFMHGVKTAGLQGQVVFGNFDACVGM